MEGRETTGGEGRAVRCELLQRHPMSGHAVGHHKDGDSDGCLR